MPLKMGVMSDGVTTPCTSQHWDGGVWAADGRISGVSGTPRPILLARAIHIPLAVVVRPLAVSSREREVENGGKERE